MYTVHIKSFIPGCLFVILGCSNFCLTVPLALQQDLMFGMVIAKRVILRECKSVSPPCFKKWLNDIVSCTYLEEIRCTLSDDQHKFFFYVWGPFVDYIRRDRCQPPN